MEVKLTEGQVKALTDIHRAIQELSARRDAMIAFAASGAGIESPRVDQREDGVYLVASGPDSDQRPQ